MSLCDKKDTSHIKLFFPHLINHRRILHTHISVFSIISTMLHYPLCTLLESNLPWEAFELMIGILFYDGHDKKARKYAEERHQAVGREN